MNIALYSGSFNPIHRGHTSLAGYLIEKQIVDEVWFVVSPCNPLKNQHHLLDEYLRLDMLILAIKGEPAFKACDVEFTMPLPSFTIDTLSKLSTDFPEHRFSLIIGSDNALVFDKWKNYNEILTNYPVFVYPRRGYNFADVVSLYPQMTLLETPFYDISSTQIRESIAQKKDVSQWLHPDVMDFIEENMLYQA